MQAGHPVAGAMIRMLAAVRRAPLADVLPAGSDERHRQDLETLALEVKVLV